MRLLFALVFCSVAALAASSGSAAAEAPASTLTLAQELLRRAGECRFQKDEDCLVKCYVPGNKMRKGKEVEQSAIDSCTESYARFTAAMAARTAEINKESPPMPDVIGVWDGRGLILAPDRQDWTTICGSRAEGRRSMNPRRQRWKKGDRIKVVGIRQNTAENARWPCKALEIVPL